MTSHDKPDPSTGLKEKNWKAMRKPHFCINIHQSIPWTDKSPHLLLSLCFCSPQPFCFLCLLCCIWCSSLLLPNHLNTAKELQRGFALRGIHTPWTHSLQFSNLVFELLNLKQGQNKALWCSESVVKLFSCCTIATNYRLLAFYVEATLKCHDATKLVEPWVSNDQPQAKTSTKMFQLNMVWWCMMYVKDTFTILHSFPG